MTDQALALLKEKYGTEFGANAVKEVAKELNTSYATLSKYLNQYKVGRGKWSWSKLFRNWKKLLPPLSQQ